MKKILITIISISSLFASCKNSESKSGANETVEQETAAESTSKEAICLLDKLSVRETPKAKGKWITSMSLGEKVNFTGEEITDSISKKLYYKVVLTDGKEGWTRATFLAVNGKVVALLEDASMYKRADLLTKTDKKYSAMDIIAVIGNQDDWIQVKGKRAEGEYIEEGWIKTSNITDNPVDIATAKFASMAMDKPTMTERIKALQELIENPDLSSSAFSNLLKTKIQEYELKNKAIDTQDVKDDTPEEF